MTEAVRIEVDFNYGGRNGDSGVVFLGPKPGRRPGLRPLIRKQFDQAGVKPRDGLAVIIFEPRCDRDDEGRLCDMEAPAVLAGFGDDSRCRAIYEWDAVIWVPSETTASD